MTSRQKRPTGTELETERAWSQRKGLGRAQSGRGLPGRQGVRMERAR